MEAPILFFDGVCGLCNRFVDFCLARDRRGFFRYAPLQGETAARLLPRAGFGDSAPGAGPGGSPAGAVPGAGRSGRAPEEAASEPDPSEWMRSVVLWQDGRVYRKSEAVIRIGIGLGGIWRLAALGRVVPASLRDIAYDFIARNRYRWFGKRETCRMPSPAERALFLP